jgi:hypothetical protein
MSIEADKFSFAEKVIIRNQRIIMLALSNVVREATRNNNEGMANQLHACVRQMEHSWEWLASPSERL